MNYDSSGLHVVTRGRYVLCGDRIGVVIRVVKGLAIIRWQGDVAPTMARASRLTVQDVPRLTPAHISAMDSMAGLL